MAEADTMADRLISPAIEPEDKGPPSHSRRKAILLGIAGTVLLAGTGYGVWYSAVGSYRVKTDNAYVGADTAQLTPMVPGQVTSVLKSDTDAVRRGDVLVRLDDSDAQITLASAKADLSKVTRQFGQSAAMSQALSAQVQAREADVDGAKAQLTATQAAFDKAQVDFDRRQKLSLNGAVSGDELTSAINALASARASVAQARANVAQTKSSRIAAAANLAANNAIIQGATAASTPDVLSAKARVKQAELDLSRTVVRAPIDGIVTSRTIQVGQRVAAGTTLLRIVPVGKLFVDANFKEGQLEKVAAGQPVKLTSDLYGSNVIYHGKVLGFAGGTGSSFALIPAQNATGNWIKVVQRLPVRITLDPRELRARPLRVGLSMFAEIDTKTR